MVDITDIANYYMTEQPLIDKREELITERNQLQKRLAIVEKAIAELSAILR